MDAIINAPDRLAHAVLVALCDDSATLARALLAYSKLEPAYIRANSTTASKSKRPAEEDVYICENCNAPSQRPTIRPQLAATTKVFSRTGEMEPDYDGGFWDDHDEDCHGIIDSEFCKEEYPEGFFYDCCGVHCDEDKPCVTAFHTSSRPPRRLKFGHNDHANSAKNGSDQDSSSEPSSDADQDSETQGEDDDGALIEHSEQEYDDEQDHEDDEAE